MTNLLIGYPDIGFRASSVSYTTGTDSTDHPASNATFGSRNDYVQANGAAGASVIQWDLGAAVTATTEFLFIAGANLTKAQNATRILLYGNNGGGDTTVIGTSAALQSRTYTGPRSHDLMFASGFNDDVGGSLPSSAFRYWKLEISHAYLLDTWRFRKAYFGLFLDLGHDPVFEAFKFASAVQADWNREPRQVFTLGWKGITNAKRNSFITNIYRYRDVMSVVLYDAGNYIFNGAKTMHCAITGARFSNRGYMTSDLEVDFEELI